MAETTSHGIRIGYDDLGQGEPALLMLPGWCGSRRVFDPLAQRCAERKRTLVLDWRGHGQSQVPPGDFGMKDLVEDALAVVRASGAREVVPVALSHAGWIAIELRRRLGAQAPKLVLLDWLVLDPPPQPFREALGGLQSQTEWERTRGELFAMWVAGVGDSAVTSYVHDDMGSYGYEMWARAGREIGAAYARFGGPLRELAVLDENVPVLHLYAQPEDPGYLAAQQAFAAEHCWFQVRKLDAHSHFPVLEAPDEMARAIEAFVA